MEPEQPSKSREDPDKFIPRRRHIGPGLDPLLALALYKKYRDRIIEIFSSKYMYSRLSDVRTPEDASDVLRYILSRLEERNLTEAIKDPLQIQMIGWYSSTPGEKSLIEDILQDLLEENYVYNYFGILKIDDPHVEAFLGEIPLKPQTFELASETPLDYYAKGLQMLTNPVSKYGNYSYYKAFSYMNLRGDYTRIPFDNHLGWSKKQLRKAILDSGLQVPATSIVRRSNSLPYGTVRHGFSIPLGALGLPEEGARYPPDHILPGFASDNAYMSKAYYETIYRRIFDTLNYIDWNVLCRTREISRGDILMIATIDFGIPFEEAIDMSNKELCNLLNEISQERRQTLRLIAEEATELAPELIYQPTREEGLPGGGTWLNPEVFQRERVERRYSEPYQEILSLCDQLEQIPISQLIQYAEEMGITLPLNPTKEEVCRRLRYFIERSTSGVY